MATVYVKTAKHWHASSGLARHPLGARMGYRLACTGLVTFATEVSPTKPANLCSCCANPARAKAMRERIERTERRMRRA